MNVVRRIRERIANLLQEAWEDFQAEQKWKYEELSPAQLLERWDLLQYSKENGEFARANWFWGRRPWVITMAGYLAWLIVTVGLPFWLFMVPRIGMPLIMVSAIVVNIDIIQSLRWRRHYELTIDRLIRSCTNPGDPFVVMPSPDQPRPQ